jgi:glycosyltransferase involved in cell wall biosynthesis
LLQCAKESFVFKGIEGKKIYNCIDFSIFTPYNKQFCRTVFSLPMNKKILLFVSDSLDNTRKGFDILVDAVKQSKSNDIHLCAIGKKPHIENFDSSITYLGKIKDERFLALAYSAADAFVLPSREDNLPNVMLEALACGIPVLSLPIGGMLDVIKTGFNGILAEECTSSSFSKTLNEFISDRYHFDAHEIREDARNKFSPQKQATEYVEVYKKILN